MAIWSYDNALTSPEDVELALSTALCIFCGTQLDVFRQNTRERETKGTLSRYRKVHCCPVCGWWTVKERAVLDRGFDGEIRFRGTAGVLQRFAVDDPRADLADVRQFLAAQYSRRYEVDPWRFEEVVASVYADLGYTARTTVRSGDGGIDVFLDGPQGLVGVQVKRTVNRISVEQIRAFCGALYLRGVTAGVFVTTSEFPRGAQHVAGVARIRGMELELVDAARFYDVLGLAQRKAYAAADDPSAPFVEAPLIDLDEGYVHGLP